MDVPITNIAGCAVGAMNISALEVFSPAKIVEALEGKDDCTDDLIEIIKTTQPLQLKKLAGVFLKIQNFDIEKIIELTVSRTRIHRFNSTYLTLLLIKSSYLSMKMLEKVEVLFQSVFVSRFRDVDPSIRAMCVQFLCDWILSSSALRSGEYLKYIGWALNDKSDTVRRRAVKAFLKISKFCRPKDEPSAVETFVRKYKTRLVEISLEDCNPSIQKECCKTVLSIFLKNESIFEQSDILAVMSGDETYNNLKYLALKKLCPEGIWDLDGLHGILEYSKPHVFKNLRLSDSEAESFVLNIVEYIKTRSTCCSKGTLCFLEILSVLSFSTDPAIFIDLFEAVKDNTANVKLLVTVLRSVKSFSTFPGSTFKILDYVRKLVQSERDDEIAEEFIKLLRMLEESYSLQVEAIIPELREKYTYSVIKYFDISDFVTAEAPPVIKCYAALWKVLREDYEWIRSLQFGASAEDAHMSDTKLTHVREPVENFLELLDFLIYFHSKMSLEPTMVPVDPPSSARMLFDKLMSFISKNQNFDDQESCMRLFKLISLGYFTFCAVQLFQHCPEELLMTFVDGLKDVKPLVLGYFEYLESGARKCPELAKKLAGKIKKDEKERYFLGPIKRLVSNADLLDTVLINFVPCLNTTECIVLENMAPKSKFKSQLLRKCKSSKVAEENITFI